MAGFVSLNCVAAESRDILFIDKLFPYIYIRFKKSCSEWLGFFGNCVAAMYGIDAVVASALTRHPPLV
jgi:hypothetical protein